MKTTILIAAIFCCTQVIASALPRKPFPALSEKRSFVTSFSFIRGYKQGKNTTVSWGMKNNTGISHFIVECTYEDPNNRYSVWDAVGIVPCTSTPVFKFIDSPVLPGTLNYRIIAVMNDNTTTITSDIYKTNISWNDVATNF